MAFLLKCPNCGERNVYEFRFGGEVMSRPAPDASQTVWTTYLYDRRNAAGAQREWWSHKCGCRHWFVAVRHTVTNEVQETSWPEQEQR